MRRLLLPLFIIRLVTVSLPFLVSAVFVVLSPVKSFLITLVFFAYFILLLGKTLKANLTPPLPVPVTLKPSLELENELAHWHALYEQQPTHRDVLYNLSVLYSAQGDEEKARHFLQQARAVDPNHELFR